MRLTLLVRADMTGLGIQTRAYYKHLKPHKTVLIDISNLNGNPQHYEWYEDVHVIKGIPTNDQVNDILQDTDILLTAETPYNLDLYRIAREKGIKTICVENPEFYDHIKYPQFELPDLMILPSVWKEAEIRRHAESRGTRVIQLHHPVDREEIHFKLRTTTKPLHIAGKPAANDRNGTWNFLQACHDGVVITQDHSLADRIKKRYSSSRVLENVDDQNWMYQVGDILVLPRKYGGNCLPLNEALASGMPVIMTDIEPNNSLLPKEWLVPAVNVGEFYPRTKVDIYEANPDALREKIAYFDRSNIEAESRRASDIADTISWTTLLPKWRKAIYE